MTTELIYDTSKQNKRNSSWTEKEDKTLIEKAKEYNFKNWASVAAFLPRRTPIQCSARYNFTIKSIRRIKANCD